MVLHLKHTQIKVDLSLLNTNFIMTYYMYLLKIIVWYKCSFSTLKMYLIQNINFMATLPITIYITLYPLVKTMYEDRLVRIL